MKKCPLTAVLFIFFLQLLIGPPVLSVIKKSHPDSLEVLRASLPDQIDGWSAKPEDSFFDAQTIFDYIDGAGELYLAYKMRNCLSRRYLKTNDPAIVLDIFELDSSDNAFGVFTHDQDGEPLDVGQGALYRVGWLSFWKNRFFVSIYAEEETTASEDAVKKLGKLVASLITARGQKPKILLHLPSEGLQPRSIRYFHHNTVLNFHYYLSDENILNLGPRTDAALAQYQQGEEHGTLLLVEYPDAEGTTKALASFVEHYLPEADATASVLLENGKWCAAVAKETLLAIVLEADSRMFSEILLKKTEANRSASPN
jgi:hypothetical protein